MKQFSLFSQKLTFYFLFLFFLFQWRILFSKPFFVDIYIQLIVADLSIENIEFLEQCFHPDVLTFLHHSACVFLCMDSMAGNVYFGLVYDKVKEERRVQNMYLTT